MDSSKDYSCSYLDHAIMVSPYGEVRPCCRFDANAYTENFHWDGQTSLEDFYRSGIFQKVREQLQQGKQAKGCRRCYEEESVGIPSMRQKEFPTPLTTDQKDSLTFVELGVGRLCNLKCRSCNASFSTKWESDAKKIQQPHAPTHLNLDLSKIDVEMFAHTKSLKVTGGEPFLHKSFENFVDKIVDKGWGQQIEIEVFTNGTVFPSEKFLNALAKFNSVIISISVDALSEQNHYLRKPCNWDQLSRTSQSWKTWADQEPHTNINIVTTVSLYNILSLVELTEWVQSLLGENTRGLIFQIVHDPDWMSLERTPLPLKKELFSEFNRQIESLLNKSTLNPLLEKRLKNILKLIETDHVSPIPIETFISNTAELDNIRQENFAVIFPRLQRTLNRIAQNESAHL